MTRPSHYITIEKLIKKTKRRVNHDALKNIQMFADKILNDIITRASLLCKHNNTDIIDYSDIAFIIEKNFDYTFGIRELRGEKEKPSDQYTEKVAEISKQK